MKYAIIIPDGAADDPLPQLDGRTPLQAARTPNMDALAAAGRVGTARTVPDGFESGSDVAIMSLLGYDPAVYHTGRAPLEAAAQRIPLSPTDWVFRCNLVTVDDAGVMQSRALGGSVVGVGKYLSPRLYVGYGVSMVGAGQVVILKYLLRKGFDIELESSTVETRGSVNWRTER